MRRLPRGRAQPSRAAPNGRPRWRIAPSTPPATRHLVASLLDGPAAGRRRRREPHASRDRATAFRSWHRAPIQTRLAQANLGERMGERCWSLPWRASQATQLRSCRYRASRCGNTDRGSGPDSPTPSATGGRGNRLVGSRSVTVGVVHGGWLNRSTARPWAALRAFRRHHPHWPRCGSRCSEPPCV
jgi:hypothetical protein